MSQLADGEALAGWWWRALAYLIDGWLTWSVAGLATHSAEADLRETVVSALQVLALNVEGGASLAEMLNPIEVRFVILAVQHIAIAMVVSSIYFAVMLRWKSASIGQLACGLRVQLKQSRPERLPPSTIAIRVGVQFLIPGLLTLHGLYTMTGGSLHVAMVMVLSFTAYDLLGALWDTKNQTLHDKVAGTVVVRTRQVNPG